MAKISISEDAVWLNRTTPPHIWTLVLMAGLSALNMNIFLPSLPGIAAWFEADYATAQLAISAYLAMTALLQLIIGPLSDRFGRRPVVLASNGIFLLATLGCLLAPTIEIFLVFRLISGAAVTGMVLSRAVVRDMVHADHAASMIGYITMGMVLVPMVGPIIGGFLEQAFGWQSAFLLVFLFGLAVTVLIWADLGETNSSKSTSFGAQFRTYPELVKSRRFWGYALTAGLASGAFFAFLGGAPFVATVVLGLSPAELGLYFIFISLGYMGGNFLTGRYSKRIGMNRMMLMGAVIASSGMVVLLLMFLAGYVSALGFFGLIGFVGFGNGMTMPNANAGVVSVRPHLAGSASGLGGALMIGFGAVLSAVAGALLSEETGAYPLIIMMLASSTMAGVTSYYVIARARKVGELE